MEVHSVLFNKALWNCDDARKWLKKHNLVPIKRVHVTTENLRYRIKPPELFQSFVTKHLNHGITFVFGIA